MLSSFSSNAILAKARAMYGRRLTDQNYRDLLACKSVGEIAGYLKNHTAYRKILAGINENDVHRGHLENTLRQKLFEDYAALCRYEISVGEHFSQYLVQSSEIEQILHSVMLLNAGTPEEYLFSMPYFLNRHTRIDLTALSRLQSFDDLLGALSHTPYLKILERFRPHPGEPLDYTGMEHALYTTLYSSVFDIIQKYTHGETERQLKDIFDSYIDLLNYVRIVRLKFTYRSQADFIRSLLLPFGTLRRRTLNEMIASESEDELEEIMRKTAVGKHFLKIEHSYVDEIPNRVKYITCRRDIRFSVHPSVVMISYVFLMQIELVDIITIVEGIRYSLPPEEIKKLLTIINFKKERGV